MKKSFVEKINQKQAYKIIRYTFGDRFNYCTANKIKSKSVVNFFDEEIQGRIWGFFNPKENYLNVYVQDKKTGFYTSVCLLNSKVVVLGYEDLNNSKEIQSCYKQVMIDEFGSSYKRYLKKLDEKLMPKTEKEDDDFIF